MKNEGEMRSILDAAIAADDGGDEPETHSSGWRAGRHALALELLGLDIYGKAIVEQQEGRGREENRLPREAGAWLPAET